MDTTANKSLSQRTPPPQSGTSLTIPATLFTNALVVLGSIALGLFIFNLSEFGNLGRPVQYFVALVAFVPALLAAFSNVYLLQQKATGRYLALIIQLGGFLVSAIVLSQVWEVFLGFEDSVNSVMANANWLLGIALAYALFWLAGRLPQGQTAQIWLERIALAIGGLSLFALLLLSNAVGVANTILDTYFDADTALATWGATVALVIFAVLGIRMLNLGEHFGETPDERTAWQGWLMLTPNIVGFLIFFAGPLLLSLYLSFTDSSVGQVPEIIGFENYTEILALEFQMQDDLSANAQDALSFGYASLGTISLGDQRLVIGAKDVVFWLSLRNTIVFCLLLVPLSIVPAIALSLILNSKIPGMKFFRAVYFLPSVAAVVGTALIWRWLYDPVIGYFNYIITQIVTFLNNLGLDVGDPEIGWLNDPNVVLLSIVLLAAWQVVGYNTVLFLAGLQGIPKVLYEAATVDGANRWQQFRSVTLPMLAPTTFFVTITTVIKGLQVFAEPYALFPARPIPVNATTSVFYLYEQGFTRFQFGYASSIAWLLFGLIFLITLAQFRAQRSSQAYDVS